MLYLTTKVLAVLVYAVSSGPKVGRLLGATTRPTVGSPLAVIHSP